MGSKEPTLLSIDKDFRDRWGEDHVAGLVQFTINDGFCTETGVRRFEAMFGSEAGTYLKLPEKLAVSERSDAFLVLLNEDLKRLEAIIRSTHAKVVEQRKTRVDPNAHNVYPTRCWSRPAIASSAAISPVQPSAKRVANQEEDQTTVPDITAWRGDPMIKTTLSFRVLFADGDVRWLPFTKDLDATVAIGTFFLAHPPLRHLSFQNAQAIADFLRSKRREPITGVKKGEVLYVDMRSYGQLWYDESLTMLEDRFDKKYSTSWSTR